MSLTSRVRPYKPHVQIPGRKEDVDKCYERVTESHPNGA